MSIVRRIKRLVGLSPTPIYPGRTYTDHITGESFHIESVGRWVTIERHDADRYPTNRLQKERMRQLIDMGIVELEDDG